MSIFFIEDKNGDYFSTDKKRRFIKLSGQEAYRFLKNQKGKGRRFYKTTIEERGEKVFVEVPADKIMSVRKEESREQYVSKCKRLFEGSIISIFELEDSDEKLTVEEVELTDGESAENLAIYNMDIEILHTAINSLSDEEIAILNMLYLSENRFSETAIAERLGVSVSAVCQRKMSIIKKLKKFFKN